MVGGRVGVDLLVDEAVDSMEQLHHGRLCFPVLGLKDGHTNLAPLVDVDVQKLFGEVEGRGCDGVVVRECDFDRDDHVLPWSMGSALDPEHPEVFPHEAVVLAVDDAETGVLPEELEFVEYPLVAGGSGGHDIIIIGCNQQ